MRMEFKPYPQMNSDDREWIEPVSRIRTPLTPTDRSGVSHRVLLCKRSDKLCEAMNGGSDG